MALGPSQPTAEAGQEPADDGPNVPILVIEPGSLPLRQYARDLAHHRDLLLVLATRDLKLRYRQTALGVSWVLIQPLLAAGILGFVFGRVAGLPTDGVPAFIFTFAGLLAWGSFSNSASRAAGSLTGNAGLVSKIFFPRLLLPLSSAFGVIIDATVSGVLLFALLVLHGLTPNLHILAAPVWLLVLLALGLGSGCLLASLAVRYRDVLHITPVLIQLGLYASPIAYSVKAVPVRYETLYYLNPVAGCLQGFRWSVFGTGFPPAWAAVYAAVAAGVLLVAGSLTLERMERAFADVI